MSKTASSKRSSPCRNKECFARLRNRIQSSAGGAPALQIAALVGRALRLPSLPIRSVWIVSALLTGLAISSIAADQPKLANKQSESKAASIPWSKTNTKIANHYIQILQTTPAYGRVLNLLRDLYRRHQQEDLLLSYFKNMAEPEESTVAKILYAHLLRKNGDLTEALKYYQQSLSLDPDEIHALRGTAEILDQEEKPNQALLYYDRLIKVLPTNHKDSLPLQLHRADLLKSADRVDEAVQVWNQLLTENPSDKTLSTQVVALLLETGRPDEAIRILQQQTQSNNPEEKLAALESLSKLYGFIDDFDQAIKVTGQAKSLLHFKDYRYQQFFAAEERLYERFDRLKDFEKILLDQTTQKSGSEASLRDLADFYKLTAKPKQEQVWVKRLIQSAPSNAAYSLRLAELLIENEEFQLAAAHLDQLIQQQQAPPVSLIFMRSLAALNTEGKEAAEAVLNHYLSSGHEDSSSPATLKRLLDFARYHYLDQVVEMLLSGSATDQNPNIKENAGAASLALAKFFNERGRKQKARETIAEYIRQNHGSPKSTAHRLSEAAKVYAELKMYAEAETALQKALLINPAERETLLILASVQTESGKTEQAVASYNLLWQDSPDLAAQTEIDHRLFSLLRALVKQDAHAPGGSQSPLLMGPPQTRKDFLKLARAASLNANAPNTDEPLPEELLQFYQTIKQQAAQQADLRHKYRVAWWAFKIQDYREMYHQLAELHQPKQPVVEVEKLMLELAELTGNTLLAGRKLKLLAEIDKAHESEYLRRWAEFRFKMEYQDQAVRLMEELARRDDASLSTLKSLVGFYKKQGRSEDQLAVWRSAYDRANIDEKRQIVKQLTTTLLEMGKIEEALEVQLDLIEKENDPARQRRLFESQLTLATRTQKLAWLKKRYAGLLAQAPFERFYPEALGKIHRALGDSEAAYQVLKKAYYMSDQDQSLLAQLGELADQSNDLKAAIYYRRQLIVSDSSKSNLESWQLLIEMLEKDLRVGEADLTRERFEGKFARDTAFLRESATYYLKTHRPEKAKIFYQKLVKLRPWDSALWLELGLLQKENGQREQALGAFIKAIDTSHDDALKKKGDAQGLSYLPVVKGGWHSNSEPRLKNSNLESLITGIQEYRFLDNEQQEELVSWLRRPHPEFHRVPSERFAVRFRAIEEAARLSKNDPATLKKWIARWSGDKNVAAEEQLWATFYADAFDLSQSILEKNRPAFPRIQSRFFHTLLSLRMGHAEILFKKAKPQDQQESLAYPVLATLLLLQESPDAISQQDLETVFQNAPLTLSIARHLQNNLQLDGKLSSAFKVGKALARTQQMVDADFLYKISKSAEWLGRDQQRLYWLERSLQAIEPNSIRGLPVSFFGIASELHGLRESAGEKSAVLDYLLHKVANHSGASPETVLESRLKLAMISGKREEVLTSLRELTLKQVESGLPSRGPSSRRGYGQVQHWIGMERILNEHVRRLPTDVSPNDFYAAMSVTNQASTQDAAVSAQFQQFSMARLMWLLTDKNAPERRQRVAEFSPRLKDETLLLELARTLEARGFYREAIPVYLQLIESDAHDFTLIRGFFAACRKSRDHQAALKLIDLFLNQQAERASGMTDLYLVQNHAYFLGLSEDVKSLLSYARQLPPTFKQSSGPDYADLANEYYRSLLKLYRDKKQPANEFDILQRLKARKGLTRIDHLTAGRLLVAQNKQDEALVWLEALELNQSQVTIEMECIRLLADIYAKRQGNQNENFAQLSRQALKYNNSDLILHLATRLNEVALGTMADSTLLLRLRSSQSSEDQTALLLALIKGRLSRGENIEDSAAQLRTLLSALDPASPLVGDFFKMICSEAKSNPQGILGVFANSPHRQQRPGSATLWKLSQNVISSLENGNDSSLLQGLHAQSMSEAELMCVIEQVIDLRRPADAEQLLSDYATSSDRPLGFENPSRLLNSLAKLKDNNRAAALHTRLRTEATSETFRRRVRLEAVPNFIKRQHLPNDFASAGYPDLAKSLYQTYFDELHKDGRVPGDFLNRYARLLIRNGDYANAENLLVQLFQRASNSDDETILAALLTSIDLYQKWPGPKAKNPSLQMQARIKRYHLSPGLQIKIDDLNKAHLKYTK